MIVVISLQVSTLFLLCLCHNLYKSIMPKERVILLTQYNHYSIPDWIQPLNRYKPQVD
jgi:hypothetical protein